MKKLICLIAILIAPLFGDVTVDLFTDKALVEAGESQWVALRMKMDEGWHTYWKNPGETGVAPRVDWELPEGFEIEALLWPHPKRFESEGFYGYGYINELTLLAKLRAPEKFESEAVRIGATVSWVICKDTCRPGRTKTQLVLGDPSRVAKELVEEAIRQVRRPSLTLPLVAKAGRMAIELPEPTGIEEAFFFPDEQGAWLGDDGQTLDGGTLTLPESDSLTSGVLVLVRNGQTEAFDISLSAALDEPEETQGNVFLALILAFVGGVILNLMPCVLPVISIKILSFAEMAGQDRRQIFAYGLTFTVGVILSFWLLAGVLLVLRSFGQMLGWGFHLQEPYFVLGLIFVLLALAMNLFGVFELGTGIQSHAGQAESKNKGLAGAFFSGVLATAVATPCTGPFLGPALGFAVTLPPISAMAVFTSMGLGLSLPYLLLCGYPELLQRLPKPGMWMIRFKQAMGFLLVGSLLWLVWVFDGLEGTVDIFRLMWSILLASIALWIYGIPTKGRKGFIRKTATELGLFAIAWLLSMPIGGVTETLFCSLGIITSVLALWVYGMPAPGQLRKFLKYGALFALLFGAFHLLTYKEQYPDIQWEKFTPERRDALVKEGKIVFVDFTARWCTTCQANKVVFMTSSVKKAFKDKKVVALKADWSNYDPIVTAELQKFGRNSIPLYLVYHGKRDPTILPTTLTSQIVVNALEILGDAQAR